jgi:hypothetical protein
MVIKLVKGNITMTVRDKNQAAAFLSNGWKKASEPESVIAPIEQEIHAEEVNYTKTDINRLSTAELKELATNEGIEGAEDKTGGELKKELIEHFNL